MWHRFFWKTRNANVSGSRPHASLMHLHTHTIPFKIELKSLGFTNDNKDNYLYNQSYIYQSSIYYNIYLTDILSCAWALCVDVWVAFRPFVGFLTILLLGMLLGVLINIHGTWTLEEIWFMLCNHVFCPMAQLKSSVWKEAYKDEGIKKKWR